MRREAYGQRVFVRSAGDGAGRVLRHWDGNAEPIGLACDVELHRAPIVFVRSGGDGDEQITEPSGRRSGRAWNRGCPGDGISG